MAITSVFCRVAHGLVTRVTDLEGEISRVICPEYEGPTGVCQLKKRALEDAPLSRFLGRFDADMLDRRTTRCDLQ